MLKAQQITIDHSAFINYIVPVGDFSFLLNYERESGTWAYNAGWKVANPEILATDAILFLTDDSSGALGKPLCKLERMLIDIISSDVLAGERTPSGAGFRVFNTVSGIYAATYGYGVYYITRGNAIQRVLTPMNMLIINWRDMGLPIIASHKDRNPPPEQLREALIQFHNLIGDNYEKTLTED